MRYVCIRNYNNKKKLCKEEKKWFNTFERLQAHIRLSLLPFLSHFTSYITMQRLIPDLRPFFLFMIRGTCYRSLENWHGLRILPIFRCGSLSFTGITYIHNCKSNSMAKRKIEIGEKKQKDASEKEYTSSFRLFPKHLPLFFIIK